METEIVKNYICDLDGVLVSGDHMIPGADKFIARLRDKKARFLVLTNNSRYTPRDLSHNLQRMGLDIPEELLFTSAKATARFLKKQRPNGTAFVVGESGLTTAIHEAGYVITDHAPDYVVLGETSNYSEEILTKATRLILEGARFIATNPDATGPGTNGISPACGAVAALLEAATGVKPFFTGKPNPLMIRTALNYLGVHSDGSVMVGDRMDTDIITGVQNAMETILVLSGITKEEDIDHYPYRPTYVVKSVAEIKV